MDGSDETENLPVATVVLIVSINLEEQLDGSGEDDNLPVSTREPGDHEEETLVGSDGVDNLPVIIGVLIAIIILISVVLVIIYKRKARSYDAEAALLHE